MKGSIPVVFNSIFFVIDSGLGAISIVIIAVNVSFFSWGEGGDFLGYSIDILLSPIFMSASEGDSILVGVVGYLFFSSSEFG